MKKGWGTWTIISRCKGRSQRTENKIKSGNGKGSKFLDSKLSWLVHVAKIREKIQDICSKFFTLGRRKWGNSKVVLKTIYERVVCPMVLYGGEIWGEKATDKRVQRVLRAIERPYLRAITKVYRTAPTAALGVLVGCVTLEVQARVRYEARSRWRNETRTVRPTDRPHPSLRGAEILLREEGLTVWTDATVTGNGDKAGAWLIMEGEKRVVLFGKVNEIIRALGMGIRIRVEWRSRNTGKIKIAHRECKRLAREGGIEMNVMGTGKGFVNKWGKEKEEEYWQGL
ncbi:hypothetical protein NQ315_008246 [Exocentrus adspersus]|uniref:Reverse transcriptase n=1 Tax=Exocentrus adspersus TaxID=1586481 RepID=A0AAV8VMX8_9CUCU|nr:hypothetical protein NQ315_008246 [Exocentrus adspersus]